MNLEAARKVYWLKNNYKPLGELLDEGFLDQSRLEWAAKWAYKSELKQAAKIILETTNLDSATAVSTQKGRVKVDDSESGVEVGISLDDARTTLWPFGRYKGQAMGTLVDTKQLTLRDLGYAVENAWDERVRKAATALSLVRLEQVVKEPTPSAGFVHVVSGGRSYSERKESQLTLILGAVLGVSLTLAIGLIIRSIIVNGEPNPNVRQLSDIIFTPTGIFALLLVAFCIWFPNFILDRITKEFDKRIDAHRLGREGEDLAVQSIVQVLDGNWYLFRNVNLPGRNKGDLDLVLVGPPGVWVLEVKNYTGTYRNIGDTWEYKAGKKWKATSKSPSTQATKNIYRLKNFFKADNLNIFVNAAVVWANGGGELYIENPSVAVWRYERLSDEIGNIWQDAKLAESERDKIVDKLTKLCERQKEAQNSK